MVFVPLGRNPETLAGTAVAVHVNVVETMLEVRATDVVVPPEHIVCCIGLFVTLGDGFTFIT
jgi:hypothetical protein